MYDIFDDDSAHYAPLSSAFEPNESFATAAPITEGIHTVNGEGQDWFLLEAQAGPLEITMTPDAAGLQTLNMELRNDSNQVIAQGFTPSGAETIVKTLPSEGNYYLWIYSAQFGDSPPAGTQLDYTLDINLPQVVPADNNNTRATATPLDAGSHDILGREVDWHRITVTEGYLSLTMTTAEHLDDPADTRDDPRNLNMELYNADGQLLRANFNAGNSEEITQLITEAGDYYVKIYTAQFGDSAPDGTVLSYTLNVDVPTVLTPDGNDSQATAQTLSEGTTQVTGTGQDWFRFDSPSGTVNLNLTSTTTAPDGTPLPLNVELRTASGEVLSSSLNITDTATLSDLLDASGTYFLRVYWAAHPSGVDNVPLTYEIQMDLPTANTAEDRKSVV